MTKIAIFYHTRTDSGDRSINTEFSMKVLTDQMRVMKSSGLTDAANEIHVGLHASDSNAVMVRTIIPEKANLVHHSNDTKSLLPTFHAMQQWLPGHEDWYVCFYHAKGISHPGDPLCNLWRRCMEKWVIANWRQCMTDMDSGFESVGAHWLTPIEFGAQVKTPFWGGAFWWAKASLLLELPKLPNTATTPEDWFLPENWIGSTRGPYVRDYAHHWPSIPACGASLRS